MSTNCLLATSGPVHLDLFFSCFKLHSCYSLLWFLRRVSYRGLRYRVFVEDKYPSRASGYLFFFLSFSITSLL